MHYVQLTVASPC